MEILLYIILIIACTASFIAYAVIAKPEHLKKAIVVGIIFTIFGFLWDFIGINLVHYWDNTSSLLPELYGVPIGNIPFTIFGGAVFILLWNEFERRITKIVFLFSAAGTCGYAVALNIYSGFLIHYPPYNIGWAYLFWLGNLCLMVFCDYLYEKGK